MCCDEVLDKYRQLNQMQQSAAAYSYTLCV
jgi:hypothetical protein